jgi:hypothetical protein
MLKLVLTYADTLYSLYNCLLQGTLDMAVVLLLVARHAVAVTDAVVVAVVAAVAYH